jgi:hypothetical protein
MLNPMSPLSPILALLLFQTGTPQPATVELKLSPRMQVDVDGAPNAYGGQGKHTLDDEKNAHDKKGRIVG